MIFLGNLDNKFNRDLLPLIDNIDFTVISYIDNQTSYQCDDKNVIQLLPITGEDDYYHSINLAWKATVKNALYDTFANCTSIFIVNPEDNNVENLADIINTFDKENLIDNMWIYPESVKRKQLRNNIIEDLPYQKNLSR